MDSEWCYSITLDLITFCPYDLCWFRAQIQFLQTELFSSLCKITFPVNRTLLMEPSLERISSPAPIHFIPRCCVTLGEGVLLLIVLSSLKEVAGGQALPEPSCTPWAEWSHERCLCFSPQVCAFQIWKAVARDGASSAGILASLLQTKFYSTAWEGPSRHLPFPGHPCSCPSSGLFPKCCHPRLFNTWCSRGSSGSFRILSEAPDNSLLCCWHGCRSCDSPYFFF